ncbi:MAG: hypothetical protein KZQ64_09840 [gamma proteobacterium symbiont of Bathyaustriella thionipta]|nr:hypothetical protein [gamma proteobacterium symbiont of Bathyaustriella thionipta]MCU7949248.1 hypothetical protein [gamma proteobacterium symbiont of Bathyaustriella thionipta]MCU7953672.1 hypothetical protein [gamma proteobacterium symbiont of Bathyaustriella thionipta]MCU7955836.1 hypothetical protein [gamma proteobacterium symbiont of Bathyaustriella thionipta]MCU7966936.1 hypothetical protein [gamma proteobacterium symbiont of Bathyaustriella thionipta]
MDAELNLTKENSNDKLKTIAMIVYGLQALSFLMGITFIVAVILNYVKKDDVQGTWLESHFNWQIRTFWFSLLWSLIGIASMLFLVGYAILFADAIWVIYRIIKGWLRLNDNKAMYTS